MLRVSEDDAGHRGVLLAVADDLPGAATRRRVHAAARRGRSAVHAVGAARDCRPARPRELLQQTDRLIKTVPEVARVFGKAGRAETATDPAPLEMFETTIQFKPREQWRAGMTPDKLVEELDRGVQGAGPRRTSGCRRSAIASTCSRPASRARSASRSPAPTSRRSTASRGEIERVVKDGARRHLRAGRAADRRALHRRRHRPRCGRALRPEHRRRAERRVVPRSAARTSARRSRACSAFRSTCAIRASCAIRSRSCASCRSSPSAARRSRSATWRRSRITDGPPMLKSENARLSGWVYVDIRGRDLRSAVHDMQQAVARRSEAAGRLFDLVVRPVRVSRARHAPS